MIIEKEYEIKKFDSKGGWHFINLEYIDPSQRVKSGWNTVSGKVENVVFEKVKIWAGAKGDLFFPVNKAIRTQIKKELGDKVFVQLNFDSSPAKSKNEFWECLEFEPKAHAKFLKKSKFDQNLMIDSLDKIQNEEEWAMAVAKIINDLLA